MKFSKDLFKTYLIYFIVMLAFVLVRILASVGAFSFIKSTFWQSNVATLVIQILIMGLLPLFLVKLLFKKSFKQIFEDIGFKKVSLKVVILCVLLGICVYILNIFVASVFNFLLSLLGYSSGGGSGSSAETSVSVISFLFSTIFVAVLPAIFEEITHRGILMRGCANKTGYKKAIIISSVLFGLMHLNISQCFYATFIGMIIGFVSSMTGSIIPAIILHFMNNFLNVYVSYSTAGNWVGGRFINSIYEKLGSMNAISGFLVIMLILIVVIFAGILIILKLFKETRYKQFSNSIVNVASTINQTEEDNLTENDISETFFNFIVPYLKNYTIIELMLPNDSNSVKKFDLKTNLFLIANLFMGALITLFTFIWGVL